MGEVIPFDFEQYAVRVVTRDGDPWFVAPDVCRALGHTNASAALRRLDDDEKGLTRVYTLGGEQSLSVVSESGLYALILTSNKPAAKRFRKWVTAEVLPAIRRTGAYYRGVAKTDTLEAPRVDVPIAVIDQHRLLINRAYLATLSEVHQATARARVANMREIAALVEAGMPRVAAMEVISAKTGIAKHTLYNHLRLIRMVPEPDWEAALAPQWKKGALARLADKAALARPRRVM